jgi:flagellar assembly factor FliW
MLLDTTRFGPINVDESELYAVPGGIPGFPDLRRVLLLGAGQAPGQTEPHSDHTFYWMQDADNGELAFMCVVPWAVVPDYDIEFDSDTLGIADADDVRVLTLVTVRRENGVAALTTNLRAPLVIDIRRNLMQQTILTDSVWPVRAPIANLTTKGAR